MTRREDLGLAASVRHEQLEGSVIAVVVGGEQCGPVDAVRSQEVGTGEGGDVAGEGVEDAQPDLVLIWILTEDEEAVARGQGVGQQPQVVGAEGEALR